MQRSHFAVVCGLGATLGLFVGFIVFSTTVGGGTGAAFTFWIQRPRLYWPWPMFGAAIAGLSFYAVWMLRRPRKPNVESRADAYHALIANAVAKLPLNDRAGRQRVYDRARSVLAEQLSKTDLGPEWRELESAIRKFEWRAPHEMAHIGNPLHRPTTASLVFSILFPGIWVIDLTSMSLYWVARIPKL